MNPLTDRALHLTRREFFGRAACGVGTAALATLLARDGLAAPSPAAAAASPSGGKPSLFRGLPDLPHFAPKAKRVIYLFQNGAPTHVELFDYKPKLAEMHGKPVPESYLGGKRFSTMTGNPKGKLMLAPVEPFQQHGQSGAWVSNRFLPYTAGIVDDLCFVKSMHTDAVNHAPAISFMLSGAEQPGRPTVGAWLNYGLGSDAENLPAFVAITSVSKGTTCGQIFYDFYWGSGFLPSRYQGVRFRGTGDPVPYLNNPNGMSRDGRRALLDDLNALNAQHLAEYGDPEIDTRITQYEMAFKMQASVPDLLDFSNEPKHIIDMYGKDALTKGTFANNCLIARRLIERGTRFVQLMHSGWDQHGNLFTQLEQQCVDTDQPSAALVKDLKMRGLLDDTLVVWGGEFGRTPLNEERNGSTKLGRDHHPHAFTIWMAGGGMKRGFDYGATDDLGYFVTEDKLTVRDLQATILHALGLDPHKLHYPYQGLNQRLIGPTNDPRVHTQLFA